MDNSFKQPSTTKNEKFKNVYLIIDTTPFQTVKSWSKLYCPHYSWYCFKYQIVVNRFNGLICNVYGPWPGR